MIVQTDRAPVLCIFGPTASGKTDLAMQLADQYPCDLISVDSAQIYRHMNIGSAKPDVDTLARYPHALIDILEPEESYSAANFADDATQLIELAHKNKRLPILVGGTMLYYHALFGGLADLPASDPAIRTAIEQRITEDGLEPLYQYLISIDQYAADKLTPNDRQRIIRFTELLETTGKTPSELFEQQRTSRPSWPTLSIGLEPARDALHRRIAERFHIMIDAGFIDEVAELRNRPHLTAEHPSMRAVGYRQLWAYLDGAHSRNEAIELGIIATRQLAKRQITWMRNRLREHLTPVLFDPLETPSTHILSQISSWLDDDAMAIKK
ncbi:tRNA (adenosine(37)-N6)-dimethylallyltransferase MiaA [Cardiobacteriaceae bacterium TAE3-ERU3]|nr:tRNA (adenosine(37)-N6)-dimethylallyltransferase MiaA [Cardiobacteriaceae bacterium TAE3-ERU3]